MWHIVDDQKQKLKLKIIKVITELIKSKMTTTKHVFWRNSFLTIVARQVSRNVK